MTLKAIHTIMIHARAHAYRAGDHAGARVIDMALDRVRAAYTPRGWNWTPWATLFKLTATAAAARADANATGTL